MCTGGHSDCFKTACNHQANTTVLCLLQGPDNPGGVLQLEVVFDISVGFAVWQTLSQLPLPRVKSDIPGRRTYTQDLWSKALHDIVKSLGSYTSPRVSGGHVDPNEWLEFPAPTAKLLGTSTYCQPEMLSSDQSADASVKPLVELCSLLYRHAAEEQRLRQLSSSAVSASSTSTLLHSDTTVGSVAAMPSDMLHHTPPITAKVPSSSCASDLPSLSEASQQLPNSCSDDLSEATEAHSDTVVEGVTQTAANLPKAADDSTSSSMFHQIQYTILMLKLFLLSTGSAAQNSNSRAFSSYVWGRLQTMSTDELFPDTLAGQEALQTQHSLNHTLHTSLDCKHEQTAAVLLVKLLLVLIRLCRTYGSAQTSRRHICLRLLNCLMTTKHTGLRLHLAQELATLGKLVVSPT